MHEYEVVKAVDKVAARLAGANKFNMTHEEALRLFADAHTRSVLGEAEKLVAGGSSKFNFDFEWKLNFLGVPDPVGLVFCFDGPSTPFLPRVPVLQDEPELRSRVETWLSDAIQARLDCARLTMVVRRLHALCNNYNQMRYLFPSILPLLELAELGGTASKVRATPRKPPANTPTLSPLWREHVRRAAVTVTQAMLMPEPEKPSPGNRVRIVIRALWASLPEGGRVDIPAC